MPMEFGRNRRTLHFLLVNIFLFPVVNAFG
jgi:hypothetical protein